MQKDIKTRLKENSLTNRWLISQLKANGIDTCDSELSASISGARVGTKAERIVKVGNEIIDRYESADLLGQRAID